MKHVTDTYRRSDSLYHCTLGRRDLCDMVARMEGERDKLRELIRDLWISYDCDETAPSVAEHWHERMRALGVEVDGHGEQAD